VDGLEKEKRHEDARARPRGERAIEAEGSGHAMAEQEMVKAMSKGADQMPGGERERVVGPEIHERPAALVSSRAASSARRRKIEPGHASAPARQDAGSRGRWRPRRSRNCRRTSPSHVVEVEL